MITDPLLERLYNKYSNATITPHLVMSLEEDIKRILGLRSDAEVNFIYENDYISNNTVSDNFSISCETRRILPENYANDYSSLRPHILVPTGRVVNIIIRNSNIVNEHKLLRDLVLSPFNVWPEICREFKEDYVELYKDIPIKDIVEDNNKKEKKKPKLDINKYLL